MRFEGRFGPAVEGSSTPLVVAGVRVITGLMLMTTLLVGPAIAAETPDSQVVAAEEADYSKELRTVEEEVNGLKERVFRSKATLQLLKELVVEGASSGARIVVWHLNQMGSGYAMESVQYFLDGKNIYTKVDPGGQLAAVKEMKIHEQSVPPGTHNLQVKMVLRGSGYGVFSYLRTYQFNVQSSYAVKVQDGRASVVRVIADTRGGLRNFVDRPAVRYEERSDTLREE